LNAGVYVGGADIVESLYILDCLIAIDFQMTSRGASRFCSHDGTPSTHVEKGAGV